MAIALDTAAERMRERYILNPPEGQQMFLPLPREQMTAAYFANWIIGCVPVTGVRILVGRPVRLRIFPTLGTQTMARSPSEILCIGPNGGVYTDVRVSRVAVAIAMLEFEREAQILKPEKTFSIFGNVARVAIFRWILRTLLLIGTLQSGRIFSEAQKPHSVEPEHFLDTLFANKIESAMMAEADTFALDGIVVPKSKLYEWKTCAADGYPSDKSRREWKPVPLKRHKKAVTEDRKRKHIIRHGQILMEISKRRADKLRRLNFDRAIVQVSGVAVMGQRKSR